MALLVPLFNLIIFSSVFFFLHYSLSFSFSLSHINFPFFEVTLYWHFKVWYHLLKIYLFFNLMYIGDSGYPLQPWLLTPILHPRNPHEERYNGSLTKTRVCVERAFGILKSRFRCLDHSGGILCYPIERYFLFLVNYSINALNNSFYSTTNLFQYFFFKENWKLKKITYLCKFQLNVGIFVVIDLLIFLFIFWLIDRTCKIIMTCCVLHNICLERRIPLPDGMEIQMDNDPNQPLNHGAANHHQGGLDVRNQLIRTWFMQ